MTEKQKIFAQTVKRLKKVGIEGPTGQIIALAEEIELYRNKIALMEGRLIEKKPMPAKSRYTYYDERLQRFAVRLYLNDPDRALHFITGEYYTANSAAGYIYTGKEPDIVVGGIIDRLAELENREEETRS